MSGTSCVVDGVTLVCAAATHAGRVRTANEDAHLAQPPVLLVADGMGGYDAGDRASAAVVAAFEPLLHGGPVVVEDVGDALTRAQAAVVALAAGTARGAGSTVTGAVLTRYAGAPHWLVVNVGDSRVYRLLDGGFHALTVDHSQVQERVTAGEITPEQARDAAGREVLTRAVGGQDPRADSWLVPVVDGERLLLCSDGLVRELPDDAIASLLTFGGTPASVATALVDAALRAGGRDNVTVVVVDVLAGGRADADDDGTVTLGTTIARVRTPAGPDLDDTVTVVRG